MENGVEMGCNSNYNSATTATKHRKRKEKKFNRWGDRSWKGRRRWRRCREKKCLEIYIINSSKGNKVLVGAVAVRKKSRQEEDLSHALLNLPGPKQTCRERKLDIYIAISSFSFLLSVSFQGEGGVGFLLLLLVRHPARPFGWNRQFHSVGSLGLPMAILSPSLFLSVLSTNLYLLLSFPSVCVSLSFFLMTMVECSYGLVSEYWLLLPLAHICAEGEKENCVYVCVVFLFPVISGKYARCTASTVVHSGTVHTQKHTHTHIYIYK